jgi:hypothetical protein
MKCKYCKYDNEPAPGFEKPERCEGCGRDLEHALTGRPDVDMREFV